MNEIDTHMLLQSARNLLDERKAMNSDGSVNREALETSQLIPIIESTFGPNIWATIAREVLANQK